MKQISISTTILSFLIGYLGTSLYLNNLETRVFDLYVVLFGLIITNINLLVYTFRNTHEQS